MGRYKNPDELIASEVTRATDGIEEQFTALSNQIEKNIKRYCDIDTQKIQTTPEFSER